MPESSVSALNRALQDAQEWLKALAQRYGLRTEERAYTALRAVLHSLRDRLTVDEAVHFGAQMPTLVRGIYLEGWRPALAPNRERSPDEFFASVAESLRNAAVDLPPEEATRSVFAFLQETMDPGQMRHVKEQLPASLQELFHVPARAGR